MIAEACYAHATRAGGLALVLYDVTTLYFETPREDALRKVGMSKERRVDPQVTVGLLTDARGVPAGRAPVRGQQGRDQDPDPGPDRVPRRAPRGRATSSWSPTPGCCPRRTCSRWRRPGSAFIVGSKISKAPYDLAEHFERHGNAFDDGQTIETTRTMGTGKDARDRRVVYQWRSPATATTSRRSTPWSNAPRPSPPANAPLKKDRFVKVTDADPVVDWDLVERARYARRAQGLRHQHRRRRPSTGEQVVAAYHDLYQVERSFRMTKSDLAARPVFHRLRDSIEAHLTVVFAALAVSREAQARTGVSINKIVKTLRPLRTATITLGAPADPGPTPRPR